MLVSPARLGEFTVNISGVDTEEGMRGNATPPASVSGSVCNWGVLGA